MDFLDFFGENEAFWKLVFMGYNSLYGSFLSTFMLSELLQKL